MKYHAYDGLKGKNNIDSILVFSFSQNKTCSTTFLFYFYYLYINYSVFKSIMAKKMNSHFTIPTSYNWMDAYCKIAFFVQQIVVVVGLVHLYTEYRCQLPSVYYLC